MPTSSEFQRRILPIPFQALVDLTKALPPEDATVSEGHCAYHRRVYRLVDLIAEQLPFDQACEYSAAHSLYLFGHRLAVDQLLSLYRYGQHLVETDKRHK